jgi:hypothetical protein
MGTLKQFRCFRKQFGEPILPNSIFSTDTHICKSFLQMRVQFLHCWQSMIPTLIESTALDGSLFSQVQLHKQSSVYNAYLEQLLQAKVILALI